MSDLELFHGQGDTLADRMRAAVEAEGLLALVGDAKKQVRRALGEAVDETSRQTGTAFTARHAGWSAQFTDPQPKPQITDREAFGEWAEEETDLDIRPDTRLEVRDHAEALQCLAELRAAIDREDPQGEDVTVPYAALANLLDEIVWAGDYVLPEDPFAPLIEAGRVKVTETTVVDLGTGEPVPGTTVTKKDPELRLTPKGKQVREAAKRDVAEKLGVNLPALEGGRDE